MDNQSERDNLAAFPRDHRFAGAPGMSLRDYFAGQALVGLLASARSVPDNGNASGSWARMAFVVADAMLTARQVSK